MPKIDASQVAAVQAFVDAGCDNQYIASQFDTSEATVRRFRKKHNITSPEVVTAPLSPPPTALERAERAAVDAQTSEDRLADEVEVLKAERRRQDAVIRKLRDKQRMEDRVVATIEAAAQKPYVNPLRRVPTFKPSSTRAQTFVALTSDAHGGEFVDADQALGISYDWDICVRRMEYLRDAWIKYKDLRPYTIERIVVPVLGDMLSGDNHDELAWTNEMTMPEQAVEMGKVLAQMFVDLSEEFPQVDAIIMPGNHPRLHKKPNNKDKFAQWEYVMGSYAKGVLEASGLTNVSVQVPRDLVKIFPVYEQRIGIMHGDGVKSASFAGIPFYGLRSQRERIQALMSQTGQQRIDMLAIGHFHQYVYWGGDCDIIINGAIKGGDEYSIATLLAANEPEQVLLEFHPEHGLTSQNRINLGHIN